MHKIIMNYLKNYKNSFFLVREAHWFEDLFEVFGLP